MQSHTKVRALPHSCSVSVLLVPLLSLSLRCILFPSHTKVNKCTINIGWSYKIRLLNRYRFIVSKWSNDHALIHRAHACTRDTVANEIHVSRLVIIPIYFHSLQFVESKLHLIVCASFSFFSFFFGHTRYKSVHWLQQQQQQKKKKKLLSFWHDTKGWTLCLCSVQFN